MNISQAAKTKLLLRFYHCHKIPLHLHLWWTGWKKNSSLARFCTASVAEIL